MTYKRPFDEVMREFTEQFPDEVTKLTAAEIAERTGYSITTVRDYLNRQVSYQHWARESREEEQIRAQEAGASTYVTSSGKATVIYYPLLGEAKITSTHRRERKYSSTSWDGGTSLLLAPQDAIEIGIYLLGLQPHIREVLARKEKTEPQELLEVEQEEDQPEKTEQDI